MTPTRSNDGRSGDLLLPIELRALATVCCIGGGLALLLMPIFGLLLARGTAADPVLVILFNDPHVRPILLIEGSLAVLAAAYVLCVGTLLFRRAARAEALLRAGVALMAIWFVLEGIIQAFVLRGPIQRVAPSAGAEFAMIYDQRVRMTALIVVEGVAFAVLFGVARMLRRPHVADALNMLSKRKAKNFH